MAYGWAPNSMLANGVALTAGAYSIVLWPDLPPVAALTAVVPLVVWCWSRQALRQLGWLLAGAVLTCFAAQSVVDDRLSPTLTGLDLEADFRVLDFVTAGDDGRSVRLLVAPVDDTELPQRIRVSWFDAAESPAYGECWRLTVRLRRPRGFSNPGGFDYEHWLFRNRIGATGYVRDGTRVNCGPDRPMRRVRARLAARLDEQLPDDDAGAVLLAVTVGARHRINRDDWQRYAVTGTSHLMAISGLHVGLAAAGAFALTRLWLACIGWRGAHRNVAALVAIFAAVTYAAISGFAIPAQRAAIMVVVAALGLLLRRPPDAGTLLGTTCVVVVCLDPVGTLTPGFQLSFAAVAVLMWLAQRRHEPALGERQRSMAKVSTLLHVQVGLAFALFALTLFNFGRVAWLAPAVNLLVVPIFGMFTVPVALLGALLTGVFPFPSDVLLFAAWLSTTLILDAIEWSAALPAAALVPAGTSGFAAVTACMVAAWVVFPPGWPGRRIAVAAAALVVAGSSRSPDSGCADIHILDVGQGLAVVVRTYARTLVFDTGPSFRSGTDTGELAVVPFLRHHGIRHVDLLIVSHADQDHAGGAASLQNEMRPPVSLHGELPSAQGAGVMPCVRGHLWQWDSVRFRVLHPSGDDDRSGNNRSCVLEIETGGRRALLSGDIEAAVERELLRRELVSPAELVTVPHHGSATSSHPLFVARLAPVYAVASAGHANRWGMPKPEVVARWEAAGAEVLETAETGAVSFRLCADRAVEKTGEHRPATRRFWNAR